jgi:hypothetical protein
VSRSRRTSPVVAAASVVSAQSLWVWDMMALLGNVLRAGCKLAVSSEWAPAANSPNGWAVRLRHAGWLVWKLCDTDSSCRGLSCHACPTPTCCTPHVNLCKGCEGPHGTSCCWPLCSCKPLTAAAYDNHTEVHVCDHALTISCLVHLCVAGPTSSCSCQSCHCQGCLQCGGAGCLRLHRR